MLHAKVVELKSCKPSTSIVEHVSICARCRDIGINVIHDHMSLIKQKNDHIAKLDAKITEHNLENEKFKFARVMFYNGRHPGIKDGIGFQRGDNVKLSACSIPKIQILKFSQTRPKFKMNFKFHFKMFVCELISTNKL